MTIARLSTEIISNAIVLVPLLLVTAQSCDGYFCDFRFRYDQIATDVVLI